MGRPKLRAAKVWPLKKTKSRIFRIVYDDPDATESSGDERGGVSRRKRTVQEFLFSACSAKIVPSASTRSSTSPSGKRNKHKGVRRRRPSGRWAAEIRRPVSNERLWLGTFPTESEAVEAYRAAARRLQNEKEACGSAGSAAEGFLSASLPPLDELDPPLFTGEDDCRTGGLETVGLQDALGIGFDSYFLWGELSAEFWPGSAYVANDWASVAEIEEIFAN
ncbi:Ethylene-responsive transcription factor CRF4 [Apostasia shenzhenica]|uniref:Ethylene-responsive transcription factor CRF4 n=1 Tax=Apostasia shenzhenica TaxID=1088818 RepID=A0A2I0AHX5_9ASPA|nr:Ethylene-responsive transcription factor CRF4 [Apostasia shenzhenica]